MGKEKLINISEHDWHYRLIKFTWGFEPSIFKNLCPYFWLTIASIFVCPFSALWKGFEKICMLLGSLFGKMIDNLMKSLENGKYMNFLDSIGEAEIYYLKNEKNLKDWSYFYHSDKFKRIRLSNYSYEDILEEVTKKRKLTDKKISSFKKAYQKALEDEKKRKSLEEKRKRKQETRDERIKETMYAISGGTKEIFKFLLLVVLWFVFTGLLTGFTDLFAWIPAALGRVDWSLFFLDFWICISFILLMILANIIIIFGEYAIEKWESLGKNMKRLCIIPMILVYPFRFIIYNILWKYIIVGVIWRFLIEMIIFGIFRGFKEGIIEFGGIFGDYLDASYSDYCPGINWKKEN